MSDDLDRLRSEFESASKNIKKSLGLTHGGGAYEKTYSTAYVKWANENNRQGGNTHHIIPKKKYR